ncbi:MAG: L-arabinonate dehydratase [Candidatus Puniceispirillaceae bacterium]
MTEKKDKLRSARWFAPDDLRAFGHRSRAMQMGYALEDWQGKPVIAIINSWSDINQCHSHFKSRVEDVKRGVLQAGGFPIELPTLSLSEPFVKPTTMLYRNMMAMEVEELLRSHPVDGAVLMGGCDKTTPALLMGAISAGLPSIYLPAGPMLRGNWRGQRLGSGSDAWKYWDERRAGKINEKQWQELEAGIARSYGVCMTMGTASTMTAIAEALGVCFSGSSSIPAADSNHKRMSAACGRRAVELVLGNITLDQLITKSSVENAVKAAMASGCSTNAIIHLIAIARRAGVGLDLDEFDRLGKDIPVLANIRPTGDTYLMEDFYYAGGLPAMLKQIESKLDLSVMTVDGQTLGENLANAGVYDEDVIRPLDNPVYHQGSLAVLRGNLAPDGAVMKPAAAEARLHKHTGPAIVFDSYPEMKAAVEDETLDVTADHIMVFRNAGPVGGPGMPEWGMLPIPVKLVKQGVRDMLRISDARMSGTSYGACILHAAPEAAIGGPLALVKNGDMIAVDVAARTLDLLVDKAELQARKQVWQPPEQTVSRGYHWMSAQHIQQADKGCDFDFLETTFGKSAGEPDIF